MGVWEGGRQGGGNGNSGHREPERVLDEKKVRSAVPHCGGWLCPCVCLGLCVFLFRGPYLWGFCATWVEHKSLQRLLHLLLPGLLGLPQVWEHFLCSFILAEVLEPLREGELGPSILVRGVPWL